MKEQEKEQQAKTERALVQAILKSVDLPDETDFDYAVQSVQSDSAKDERFAPLPKSIKGYGV